MFSRFLNDVTFETLERVSVRQKEYIKKYYAASGDKACEIIFKKVNEILKCVE